MSVLWTVCQSGKNSSRMNRLFLTLFLGVVCTLAASSATCVLDGNKADSGIQVIRLDDPEETDSSEDEIIEIHIPSESRRKRDIDTKQTEKPCKKHGECSPAKCDMKTFKCQSIEDGKKRTDKPTDKTTGKPTEKHVKKSNPN